MFLDIRSSLFHPVKVGMVVIKELKNTDRYEWPPVSCYFSQFHKNHLVSAYNHGHLPMGHLTTGAAEDFEGRHIILYIKSV